MFNIVTFILISNLFGFLSIYSIDYLTHWFQLTYLSDYGFFNVVVLWGLAGLLYMSPITRGAGYASSKEEVMVDSMIDRSMVDKIDEARELYNTHLYIKLFLSGFAALLFCFVV